MKSLFFTLFVFLNITVHAQFQEHIIGSHTISSIMLTDIDNDSDNDIVISGGINNQLKWLENSDGLGNFDNAHVIIEWPFSAYAGSIAVSDIDGDNDIDVLVTTAEQDCGEIRTFKNTDGLGNFETFSLSMYTCGNQNPIEVADIDGDSDNDWASSVSASEFNTGKISWFKNNGDGIVTEQIIEDSYVRSFQLVDIDGDTDIDLIGFNLDESNNPEIFWYENTDGIGNFDKHFIKNNLNLDYYSSILVADIDNDSDMDIILSYGNKISWHENDGLGNFGPEIIINDHNFTKVRAMVVDLDSDGYADIISTGNNNSVNYYKNDGQANFIRISLIHNMFREDSPLFAKDVNGDNKIDIIASSSESGKIAWYENSGVLAVNEPTLPGFSIYPNPSKNMVYVKSNVEISQVKIYNQLGSLVLSALSSDNIDISSLGTGLYFMKIITVDGSVGVKKLLRE